MNHFYTNCRLIFFPYLIIAFGTIGLYTFLNWLLLIKLHFFIIDEDVVPVPVFAHVFPDTNRIAEILNHVNIKALFILNGKFSTKQQIKKIPADSILRMRYLNPTMVMPRYGDTGKYGAVGVITKGYKMKDTLTVIKIDPIAWLAVKYRKTISNNLSVQEKKRRFKEFAIQSETDFKYKKLNSFVYLNRIPNNKDLKNYNAAIRLRGDVADGEQVILEPVYEPFEVRNGNKLAWILGSFGTGTLIFLLILYLVRPKHSTGVIE